VQICNLCCVIFQDGPFVWPKHIQGHILGAFFYGYLISQIPGGLLAERYGGKWVLAVFACLSTLSTLLTPVAARLSFVLLIVLRICCGIGSVRLHCCLFLFVLLLLWHITCVPAYTVEC